MGLDITFKRVQPVFCPHCGEFVKSEPVELVYSSGRVWYDFLEEIEYKNDDKEIEDWYGDNMSLTYGKILCLRNFLNHHDVYEGRSISNLISTALAKQQEVVINADW